jgi:isopentenyl phosphate kinase
MQSAALRDPSKQLHVDFIVKLGGAAITHKAELESLNTAVLRACVTQLAQLAREPNTAVQPRSLPTPELLPLGYESLSNTETPNTDITSNTPPLVQPRSCHTAGLFPLGTESLSNTDTTNTNTDTTSLARLHIPAAEPQSRAVSIAAAADRQPSEHTAASTALAQAPGGEALTSTHTSISAGTDACVQASVPAVFVVVHGAGGFGHQIAAGSNLATGGLVNDAARMGFARTRASVTKLNQLVTGELIAAGLPAIAISPMGHWQTDNRDVDDAASTSGCAAVRDALANGMLPVVHGDCVWDAALGCTVLGGDKLVCSLAQAIGPRHVVFLTNVAGLYTAPPSEEGAVLLREIRVRPDGTWFAGAPTPLRHQGCQCHCQ